ncbi:integrin alpha-6-like [Oscarella lobularis]|uniref:integrin alpha-6-like n=1 Tax=Oscarella lobularis TaxID=121494 RepID=UPI003313EF0B
MSADNAFALVCSVLSLATLAFAYNVDVSAPVIKTGDRGSAFSLSLAPFKKENGDAFIIVGAPLAQSSTITNASLTGALFACPLIGAQDNCFEIGNEFMDNSLGLVYTRQLLGQSLAVSQLNSDSKSRIYSCAPLHRTYNRAPTPILPPSFYPSGKCIELNGSLLVDRTKDMCQKVGWSKNEHFLCMGGMSAAANHNHFVVGATGAFSERGSFMSLSEPDELNLIPWTLGSYAGIQSYRANNYKIPDLSYYLGFSIAMEPDKDTPVILVGSPRGTDMSGPDSSSIMAGSVALFDIGRTQMKQKRQFYGQQMNEAFGYSVALVDTTDDGTAESIVGAPFNAEPLHHNQGAVYFFMNSKAPAIKLVPAKRANDALFGAAVASSGDINKDGFNDLVVGAPGEGDDGTTSGAIYIYHGARKKNGGIHREPTQIIRARDHATLFGIRFFGFTVTHGSDLDSNKYEDILVGSFESNKAILLRSHTLVVINVKTTFSFDPIDLDVKDCTNDDVLDNPTSAQKQTYACFFISTLITFSSKNQTDLTPLKLRLAYNLTLDVDHEEEQRLFFVKTHATTTSGTILLEKNREGIAKYLVYVTPFIIERRLPFRFRFVYHETNEFESPALKPTLRPLSPVIEREEELNERLLSPLSAESKLSIVSHCNFTAELGACLTDLQPTVNLTFINNVVDIPKDVNFLLAGEGPLLVLSINVTNRGEEAHRARIILHLPPGVTYKNSTTVYKEDDDDVSCQYRFDYDVNHVGATELDCTVANPLKRDQKKVFLARFQNTLIGNEGNVSILLNASSDGIEVFPKGADNNFAINFAVRSIANLRLLGTFFQNNKMSKLRYKVRGANQKPRTLNDLGEKITHRYAIRNLGPSSTSNLKVTIWWPVQTQEKLDLFYLHGFAIPGYEENYKCDAHKYMDRCGYVRGLPKSQAGCQAVYEETIIDKPPPECDGFFCIPIRCEINRTLSRREGLQIIINATAVAKTLQQNFSRSAPFASSVLQVELHGDYFVTATKFSTSIYSRLEPQPLEIAVECVPFWIIVASAIGGLLIMAIIIFIFYMCGFFKRKTKGAYKTATPKSVSLGSGEIAKESEFVTKSKSFEMETVDKRSWYLEEDERKRVDKRPHDLDENDDL